MPVFRVVQVVALESEADSMRVWRDNLAPLINDYELSSITAQELVSASAVNRIGLGPAARPIATPLAWWNNRPGLPALV
jgi:hypothetical protein